MILKNWIRDPRRLSVEKMVEPIRNRDNDYASLLYLGLCYVQNRKYKLQASQLAHKNILVYYL